MVYALVQALVFAWIVPLPFLTLLVDGLIHASVFAALGNTALDGFEIRKLSGADGLSATDEPFCTGFALYFHLVKLRIWFVIRLF